MNNMTNKRSNLGSFARLIGVIIFLPLPFIFFAPEIFPNNFGDNHEHSHLNFTLYRVSVEEISFHVRFVFSIIVGLWLLILTIGLFSMAKMFDLLASGRWFVSDLSKQLKNFGLSLILFVIASPIINVLFNIYMTYQERNGSPLKLDFTIPVENILVLLIGVLLFSLAKVLSKASDNAQDLESIV